MRAQRRRGSKLADPLEPLSFAVRTLRNRMVRATTCETTATEAGEVASRLGDLYEELARNDVALILTVGTLKIRLAQSALITMYERIGSET
jgi:2,4-dienoyl-CoA reductase-like NADH-dependent reductase (Old Yellow Enzyme family)